MSAPPLPPGRPALFLAVRRGLPLATAVMALLCAAVLPGLRGWCLLTAVGALAEVSGSFRRGTAFIAARMHLLRWDSLWARAFRPLFHILGLEEAWLRSFCEWNNRRVAEHFRQHPARQALVLLPHCIQLLQCRAEVQTNLHACPRCGRCPVGDLLGARLPDTWEVRVSNRSYKAYLAAREHGADLVVAVSCTDRLVKGLQMLPEVPAYVIPLELPCGMCVDTRFDTGHLEAAMSTLVQPRPTPATPNVAPLRSAAS